MNLIFAVGGTGQEMLHHINTMFLSGAIRDSFAAHVVDTDQMYGGLSYLEAFYKQTGSVLKDLSRDGHPIQPPPQITLMPCGGFGAGTINEQLSGHTLPATPSYENTLNAFFSRGDLAQKTREGLYARPALSSVLVAETVLARINEPLVAKAKRIFVIGSMIGGTGGGLIVPILAKLQAICQPGTSLYCIALGEYFNPDEGRLDNAVSRFRSNWLMTRTLLEHAVPKLWKYALIEEPKIENKTVLPTTEAPFPIEKNPFWRAVVAYKHLAEDTTTDQGHSFSANAVSWETMKSALSYADATQGIDNARSQLTVLQRHSPMSAMSYEPFPKGCWGRFAEFASSIIALHKKGRGIDSDPSSFLSQIQKQLNAGVRLSKEHPEVSTMGMFPGRGVATVTPSSFRSLGWPELGPDPLGEVFNSKDDSAQAVAAATNYCAARLANTSGVL